MGKTTSIGGGSGGERAVVSYWDGEECFADSDSLFSSPFMSEPDLTPQRCLPPPPHSDTTHIMCVMFSSRAGEALDARPAIDLLSVVPNTLPPAILPKIGVSASQYPINHDLPLIQYEFASLKSTKTAVK